MNDYLERTLRSFFEAVKDIEIVNIIGSSGAFETFAEVIELQKGNEFDLKKNRKYKFNVQEFIDITSLTPNFFITNLVINDAETIISTLIGIIPLVLSRSWCDEAMSQFVMSINS